MVSTSADSLSALLGIKPVRSAADHEDRVGSMRGSNCFRVNIFVVTVVTHVNSLTRKKKKEIWQRYLSR
jgi:hypothetical protein